ncbi:MAG: hypothetical protein F4025_06765 [Synechococcus sp. SB0669_bin_7]|nr:hypothetical protein [Synechococcus sp. SB0675_bin_7]MYK86092.1 hypothetical protein [Synechococcus sp. SB0669_bin_7]
MGADKGYAPQGCVAFMCWRGSRLMLASTPRAREDHHGLAQHRPSRLPTISQCRKREGEVFGWIKTQCPKPRPSLQMSGPTPAATTTAQSCNPTSANDLDGNAPHAG